MVIADKHPSVLLHLRATNRSKCFKDEDFLFDRG